MTQVMGGKFINDGGFDILAALSTALFPFIPVCAGTHMKVGDMLHVLRVWRERRTRCTKA